ncbi:MAG: hypothetical protein HGA37_04765 [Lentimicrobium sp.]|nr:hypothetical protein [Lentimicrobium sp.]
MRSLVVIISFIIGISYADAQISAVTAEGDEVILYTNGTWEYVSEPTPDNVEIRTNPAAFKKGVNSTFQVKSKKVDLGVWINPKTWEFEKAADGGAAEFMFQKKGEDVYAMLITERTTIPLINLRDIAIQNAKEAAPDIVLSDEEYRNVNGLDVLMLRMTGTIQGIEFTYYGYYFSDESGTTQFVTYTSVDLFDAYKADMEALLNGMVMNGL